LCLKTSTKNFLMTSLGVHIKLALGKFKDREWLFLRTWNGDDFYIEFFLLRSLILGNSLRFYPEQVGDMPSFWAFSLRDGILKAFVIWKILCHIVLNFFRRYIGNLRWTWNLKWEMVQNWIEFNLILWVWIFFKNFQFFLDFLKNWKLFFKFLKTF